LQHLRDVAEGKVQPICSGADGLRTLQATLAVLQAATSGRITNPEEIACPA